jgi:hypothetical protein
VRLPLAFELRAKVASLASLAFARRRAKVARLRVKVERLELSSKCYKKAEVGFELA